MSTATHSILETIRTATESRDAATLARLYADDAELSVIDRSTPPSSPRVPARQGGDRRLPRDTCSREMTHEVRDLVEGDGRIAHTVRCLYPDGTRVVCMTIADLDARPDRPADDRAGLGRVAPGPAAGRPARRTAGAAPRRYRSTWKPSPVRRPMSFCSAITKISITIAKPTNEARP